jgi:hypothetical protein
MTLQEISLQSVVERFGLEVVSTKGRFDTVAPVGGVSWLLTHLLTENVPLAAMMNTEKARAELITANVLAEVRRQIPEKISLFSGITLEGETAESLSRCHDFLISLSTEQMVVRKPIITVVDAARANLPAAWGACCLQLLSAQRFNNKRRNEIPRIYGAVTSGTKWMFGFLEATTLTVDLQEYEIDDPERIVGILVAMVQQTV